MELNKNECGYLTTLCVSSHTTYQVLDVGTLSVDLVNVSISNKTTSDIMRIVHSIVLSLSPMYCRSVTQYYSFNSITNKMRTRTRFSRNIIASNDAYKCHSHKRMLEENHLTNIDYFSHIDDTIIVAPKKVSEIIKRNYFTRCFGKLIKISKDEAERLGSELVIII